MKTAFLGDAAAHDARIVGAKAATLSRLADRFRVPAGFCMDASVFDRLGSALDGDRSALAALRALVAQGHAELRARTGRDDPAVAVRSSAIGEDGTTIVIDACLGLGEAIASGTVTPDTYAVRKRDVAIVKRTIAGERPALEDEQVREVARLAIALEIETNAPVDVECAFAGGA